MAAAYHCLCGSVFRSPPRLPPVETSLTSLHTEQGYGIRRDCHLSSAKRSASCSHRESSSNLRFCGTRYTHSSTYDTFGFAFRTDQGVLVTGCGLPTMVLKYVPCDDSNRCPRSSPPRRDNGFNESDVHRGHPWLSVIPRRAYVVGWLSLMPDTNHWQRN